MSDELYRFCPKCKVKFVKDGDNSCPKCKVSSFWTQNAQGTEIGLCLYIQETGENPLNYPLVNRC